MDTRLLDETVAACRSLIDQRFPEDEDAGAAAMLLQDRTVLTGTAPDAFNPSVEVCHEIEPYCAALPVRPTGCGVGLPSPPTGWSCRRAEPMRRLSRKAGRAPGPT